WPLIRLGISRHGHHYAGCIALFEYTFDRITSLAHADANQRAMLSQRRRNNQPSAGCTTALSEASWRIAIGAVTAIVLSATGCTALGSSAILLAALMANVALLCNLNSHLEAISELDNAAIALVIILGHGAQQHSSHLDRYT